MVLITEPRLRSVAARMRSTHATTMSRAAEVAEHLVEARAAHDVREQDGNFGLVAHLRQDPGSPG